MIFHGYTPLCGNLKIDIERAYKTTIAKYQEKGEIGKTLFLGSEYVWLRDRRPYYNIWPGVVEPLSRLDISKVTANMVRFPYGSIAFRFAVGHEIAGVQSFLGGIALAMQGEEKASVLVIGCQFDDSTTKFCCLPFSDTRTVGDSYNVRQEHLEASGFKEIEDLRKIIQLACSCAIMDEGMLIPDVLSRDAGKDITQIEINRAHRRGKIGWNIGRSWETAPHVRRPHPCLVWTGEGSTIPKIIMRAGSIIHGSKVTTIPTGFEDESPSNL